VWAQGRPLESLRLHRVGGLATALTVLLGVVIVGQIASVATLPGAIDASKDFLAADGAISDDDFTEKLMPTFGAAALVGFATLATAIVTIIWLYRIASNHRALGRQVTFGPGWAIGGWFLPPGLWLIPTLLTREHWKAAEPTSPPGSDTWRATPEPPLVWVWFALFGPISLILSFAGGGSSFGSGFGGDVEDAAESFVDAGSLGTVAGLVTVGAAIAWLLVVRGLTRRHRQLTGEAA
jgi:hypothetical protein